MNWALKGGSSDLSGPTGRTAHSFDREALLAVPWAIGRETNGRVGLSGGSCLCPSVVSAVTGAYDEGVQVGNLADPRRQEASGDV